MILIHLGASSIWRPAIFHFDSIDTFGFISLLPSLGLPCSRPIRLLRRRGALELSASRDDLIYIRLGVVRSTGVLCLGAAGLSDVAFNLVGSSALEGGVARAEVALALRLLGDAKTLCETEKRDARIYQGAYQVIQSSGQPIQ